MRGPAFLLLLALLAAPLPGAAQIYRWTDEQGNLHFTQSLEQVPAEHRAAARAAAASTSPERVQRFSTEVVPASISRPPAPRPGTLRIAFERRGTLMLVNALLNDSVQAPFYIDTGASGISLPQHVADRLGLRIGPDTHYVAVRTANGVTSRAVVELGSVQLGGARVEGLEATVNPTMDVGLLGGSFFNHFLYHVDAAAGVITLQENPGLRGGANADEWRERFRRVRQPLSRLEAYLSTVEISRVSRREELEARRRELRNTLDQLETEANRLGVPESWRD